MTRKKITQRRLIPKGYKIKQNKDGYWCWYDQTLDFKEYLTEVVAINGSWTDVEQKELDRLNGI